MSDKLWMLTCGFGKYIMIVKGIYYNKRHEKRFTRRVVPEGE